MPGTEAAVQRIVGKIHAWQGLADEPHADLNELARLAQERWAGVIEAIHEELAAAYVDGAARMDATWHGERLLRGDDPTAPEPRGIGHSMREAQQ